MRSQTNAVPGSSLAMAGSDNLMSIRDRVGRRSSWVARCTVYNRPVEPREATAVADRLRLWQRLHVRITALYGILVVAVLTAMAVAFYRLQVDTEVQAVRERLLAGVVSLARGIPPDLLQAVESTDDTTSPEHAALLERLAAVGRSHAWVVSAYVLRPSDDPKWLRFVGDWVREGTPARPGELYAVDQAPMMAIGLERAVVEEEPAADRWGPTLSAYAPVVDGAGRSVAVAGIDVRAGDLEQIRAAVLEVTLATYAVAALLLGVIAWVVAGNVRRPLDQIIAATATIEHGRFDAGTFMARRDEFGILGRRLERMARGLEEREYIRATFGRYVDPEVVRRALASPDSVRPGGEERQVTTLVSDLRGYSTLSERLAPTQVVELLNAYLGAMTEVLEAHGGCIVEFLGDGIVAVFNAPAHQPDHAERAVRCALAMRARLGELNREWRASGFGPLAAVDGGAVLGARVGIHSGMVVAGNLGGVQHVKYSVVGDAVTVAAFLEGHNKELGTDLLLSWDTWVRLPARLRSSASGRGEVRVPGRAQSVAVYTLAAEGAV